MVLSHTGGLPLILDWVNKSISDDPLGLSYQTKDAPIGCIMKQTWFTIDRQQLAPSMQPTIKEYITTVKEHTS